MLSSVLVNFKVFVPLENCSLIWRRHYLRWSFSSFDLIYSAIMAINYRGLFIRPYLLRHVYFMVISKDPWHSNGSKMFSQYIYHISLRNGIVPHLKKLKLSFPGIFCAMFGLNLTQWFREEDNLNSSMQFYQVQIKKRSISAYLEYAIAWLK